MLRDLAESTGGFADRQYQQLQARGREDRGRHRGYYQLSYTPPPSPFDGRFRRIDVKVNRKDVVVQARSGYFALPPGEFQAVFPYEVPLLGALSVAAPPRDFEVRAAALRFAGSSAGLDHKIVVEVPIGALKMVTEPPVPPAKSGTYRLHLSLLALVKSSAGDVVERFSEDYPFEGPAEKADALRGGNIVFKRRLALAPGQYTLEVAGQDRETGRWPRGASPSRPRPRAPAPG